jgi:hypothetical protein
MECLGALRIPFGEVCCVGKIKGDLSVDDVIS